MKYLFITVVLLLMQGCSYKNAYTFFSMDKTEERYETNTFNAKIQTQEEVLGILSVTYLNNVDKNISQKTENFLVSLYMKDPQRDYYFLLNQKQPLSVKPVPKDSRYAPLLKKQLQWSTISIVTFQHSDDLNLTFYTYPSVSVSMNFLKEQ